MKMTRLNFNSCDFFCYDTTVAFLTQPISTLCCLHRRRRLPSPRPNKSMWTQLLSLSSQEGYLPFWCPPDWVCRIGPASASVSVSTGFQATSTQELLQDTTMVHVHDVEYCGTSVG